MIKILHAADLHLDSPFQALGREKAALRRAEQRTLLERLGRLARDEKVDMVLLAGDLLDSDRAYSETARLLEQTLPAMGAPVFIAPGNHDWYGPRSVWARLDLGENVHIFQSPEMSCVSLPALGARVWGAAFTGTRKEPQLQGFQPVKEPGIVDILVLHGEVGAPASAYGPVAEQDLARSGMDYAAFGHVHSFSGLRYAGACAYAWPGCGEGRGFDETGEKGVILARVEPGSCEIEFRPLGGRRYERLQVDLTGSTSHLETVLAALDRDTGRDVYRLELTGEPDTPPDLAALGAALEGRFFALELRDGTRLRRDVWAGREALSLRGLYLQRLWERRQAAQTEQERRIVELAARYGVSALENGEEPPVA